MLEFDFNLTVISDLGYDRGSHFQKISRKIVISYHIGIAYFSFGKRRFGFDHIAGYGVCNIIHRFRNTIEGTQPLNIIMCNDAKD